MSAKKVGQAVQADWDNREFVESLRLNIHRIYTFVNDFDPFTTASSSPFPCLPPPVTALLPCASWPALLGIPPVPEASAKGRLAALNSKLTSLERQLTYLESQVLSADRAGESPKGGGPELPPGMDPELAAEMQKKKAAAAKKKKKAQGVGGGVSSAGGISSRRNSVQQEANSQLAEAMDDLTVSRANKHEGGADSRAEATQSGSNGSVCGKAEIEKKIRALKKKIRQAEALESAENLSSEQVEKLKKLPDWRSEVEAMEQQLASI
ncbi:unnamed protein product [Closterium sp. NIES-64]|nr:unnamed protein product [Closterium sp. NIES-64]